MMRLIDKLGWRRQGLEPWQRAQPLHATEEDIYHCFRLLLGRAPGRKEWYGHRLTAGTPLRDIVAKFLSSAEFKQRDLAVQGREASAHEIVDLGDIRLWISTKDDVCGSLRTHRMYEPGVTSLVRRLLAPGMTFVDAGANIGYFSLLASTLVAETGRVLAVEPYPYNIKMLQANIGLNGRSNIEILPYALADRRGLVTYDDSAGNSGNVLSLDADLERLLGSCVVYAVRLDEVLPPTTRLDVIKMDIEGAEHLALKGMSGLLREHQPVIISELAQDYLRSISGVGLGEYMQALLLDETYALGIIREPDAIEPCGRGIDRVLDCYGQQESMCLDIVAFPDHKAALVLP
jgi:FkbM family methyltransferase